jgi:acetyl-CoA carboxylase carboxyl transferase subunit beta
VVWPQRKQPSTDASEKKSIGKGVFRKCDGCGATLTAEALATNFEVCPECGQHHRLAGKGWRELLLDDGALETWDEHLQPVDPLGFSDGKTYGERVSSAPRTSGAR